MRVKWHDKCDVCLTATDDDGKDAVKAVTQTQTKADLKLVEELDLKQCLKQIQIRKLLMSWKPTGAYKTKIIFQKKYFVQRYNASMGGVDRIDQLWSYFPIGRSGR